MSGSLLRGRTLCVITGASRGYGRCIAECLAACLPTGSAFLLLARTTNQLTEVVEQLKLKYDGVKVAYSTFDQSNLTECSHDNVNGILSQADINLKDFDTVIIVHNCGTTGDLTKYVWEMSETSMVENVMNVNVTGMVLLNASLLSEIRKHAVEKTVVVNVSSLAAVQSFPSLSLYCAGKAARSMFFETLAKEDPSIRVLNWAPGPLDTDMQVEIRKCADPKLRDAFTDMHKNGKLLKCEESVAKLITLLQENKFESGQHIDYYDI